MNTLIPVQGNAAPDQTGAVTKAVAWRDGAIIKALVSGRTLRGMTELTVGRAKIHARGGEGLKPGQTLTLKVTVSRNLVLLSQVANQRADIVPAAVRNALPVQSGQPPLLANLAALARGQTTAGSKTPAASVARTLLASLPTPTDIRHPEGLRKALLNSGVFLESRLAASGAAPKALAILAGDWKAALMRAARTLAPDPAAPTLRATPGQQPATPALATRPVTISGASAPPPLRDTATTAQPRAPATIAGLDGDAAAGQLIQQLTGVLARLTLAQLASLPTDTRQTDAWLLELPVIGDDGRSDVIDFRLEREAREAPEGEHAWTARLAFDFADSGPVHAQVTVRGGQVSTIFHAARAATADRIRLQLDRLEHRLGAAGLSVAGVACRCGQPAPNDAAPGRLVETRA